MGPMMLKRSSVSRSSKKARVGADLRTLEINHDGSVEAGPKGFFLAATISGHLISSRSGDFGQLYHMVTEIPASFCSVPPHNVE
jgi:hypothetical protein